MIKYLGSTGLHWLPSQSDACRKQRLLIKANHVSMAKMPYVLLTWPYWFYPVHNIDFILFAFNQCIYFIYILANYFTTWTNVTLLTYLLILLLQQLNFHGRLRWTTIILLCWTICYKKHSRSKYWERTHTSQKAFAVTLPC